ncbi:glycoside hydrolase family 43 protein [Paractinoplanes lichenicola]|uniref:Glycoside hydrolase family 43 protein n=1 Tax=Paractinoplanes lichenicola TaxID=2802976 RepID=A0ABS1VSX3_9ACTN|nr:glycoside hydrolase family 43 protein [Actinoplanes lichenicola]MBL7257571.1 glycoside hydrolase family 43 protein [Actinoplanes lichenicola]
MLRRRIIPALVALIGLLAIAGPARAEEVAGTFRNPVGVKADPFMTYFNGSYYLTMTEGDSIKMRRAASVAGLLNAPATEVWRDTNASRNKEVWAPEFYRLNGLWYMYYTADDGVDENHRLYVLESSGDNPLGPYHFKARLVPPNRDVFAIDPGIMQHNGRLYLSWAGTNAYQHNGINVAPMSNPWTVSGNAVALNAGGGCPEVREGPEFLYRNGRTWMTYSTCDTGKPDYQVWQLSIASTADPLNPANWQQRTGAVFARSDGRGVFGPGHHAFFKSPDGTQDWIVYHAKTTSVFTYNNRTTRVQRITWTDAGPNLGVPLAIGATQDLPAGDPGPSTNWINDDGRTSGNGSLAYGGSWSSGTGCAAQCFWGDDHWSGATGATATFTFTGTQLGLLSVRDTGNGIAAISVDGGAEQRVDLYSAIRFGEALNYLTPKLPYGVHTVRVRVTGERNAASSGAVISIDRAEVWS